MPRNLPDAYERQRLADEMEAMRIEQRLKQFSQKPTPEERIAAMVAEGWSLRTAREDVATLGWGGPSAHTETQKVRRFGNLPDRGGRPAKARKARS